MGLANDPLSAISGNPALLRGQQAGFQLSGSTLFVDSTFTSNLGEKDDAESGPGIIPEAGMVWAPSDSDFTFGAGLFAQSAMSAEFEFVDPPGAGGVTYGNQEHRAEYIVLSGVGAAAWSVNDALTLGATVGVAYNRNQLEAPYIFQSHPVLSGLKVLVDLDADTTALTASAGLNYRVNDSASFNVLYKMESDFDAEGSLSGNLGQLGLGIQETFSYDAEVATGLPASLAASYVWQVNQRWQLGIQAQRIFWEETFADLPIALTDGTNADLNAFLGTDRIDDVAPLDWDDQDVLSIGANFRD